MPRYKRSAADAELDVLMVEEHTPVDSEHNETLKRLRSMWEFASLMQYIFIFGSAVKIDEDFDIEDLEHECIQPHPSSKLAEIGLTLLKYVSSHRGLTSDIFAEYTRRQYLAKAPSRNPFGDDEDPVPFNDLDVYTRIRILHQLSTWTFTNTDRMRGLMSEGDDHLDWRIEPLGWDADDCSYFVLDDNRLYRRADEPVPPPTPKIKAKSKPKLKAKKGKKAQAATPNRATRASKRRKVEDTSDDDVDMEDEDIEEMEPTADTDVPNGHADDEGEPGFGFTDKTWECIAITLEEYQDFLSTIRKSRDPNEKALRIRIENEVLPIIEKRAEALRAKQLKKLRELENLQKMATAKRSSRLADKAEKSAKEQEERDAEERRAADIRMARREQERQRRIEEGHESRRLTREQRLKEREVKRILHEEELDRLEREVSTAASQPELGDDAANAERKRLSSRNLQNQREAHMKELSRLEQDQEEDKWYFDCVVCGMHGENLDDGSHSVACERCNVWQHSHCHGFTPEQCEDEKFHFVCKSCHKKERAEQVRKEEQRSGVVLKLGKRPPTDPPAAVNGEASAASTTSSIKKETVLPDYVQRQLAGIAQMSASPPAHYRPHDSQPPQGHQPQTAATFANRPPSAHHQSPRQHWPNGMSVPALSPSRQVMPPQQQQQMAPAAQAPFSDHASQHNWMHSRAVNGAGGHPQAMAQQASPRPTSQEHSQSPQPQPNVAYSQPSRSMFSSQPRSLQAHPSYHQAPPAPMNAHASPQQITPRAQPANNGTLHPQHGPAFGSPVSLLQTPQAPRDLSQQRMPSPLQSSPHTMIPPPSTNYNRQAAISPEKSSPPRSTVQASPSHMPSGVTNGHVFPATVPGAERAQQILSTPNTSFENAPKLTTPSKSSASPAPPSTSGDTLAASGMSGPWPAGSMQVPQKPAAAPMSSPRPANGGE